MNYNIYKYENGDEVEGVKPLKAKCVDDSNNPCIATIFIFENLQKLPYWPYDAIMYIEYDKYELCYVMKLKT